MEVGIWHRGRLRGQGAVPAALASASSAAADAGKTLFNLLGAAAQEKLCGRAVPEGRVAPAVQAGPGVVK